MSGGPVEFKNTGRRLAIHIAKVYTAMRQAWNRWQSPRFLMGAAGLVTMVAGAPAFADRATLRASARIVDPAGITLQQSMLSQDSITLILTGTESDLLSVKVPSDLTRIDRDTLYPMLAEMDRAAGDALTSHAVSVVMNVLNNVPGADHSGKSHLIIMAQFN